MRPTALAGACILAGTATACGDAEGGRSGLESVTRDSAGITIVENERPAPDTRLGWRIGEAPILSIGAFEGDPAYELYQVRDASRLPDGRIVVANAGTSELRVFDASGAHLDTWGGLGEGPGEFGDFAAPSGVWRWPGDSIAAADVFARRVSVFNAQGLHGRTLVPEDPYYAVIGVLPDGTMFLSAMSTFTAGTVGTGLVRSEIEYALGAADGRVHALLGTHPDSERYVLDDDRGMRIHNPPFGRSTRTAIWSDLVVLSPNDRYEIRAYGTDGSLARIVRRDHDLRSVSRADVDAYFAGQYAQASEEASADALRRVADVPLVETFPAFSTVIGDALGHLWVEDYQLPDEPIPAWTVFDSDGRVLGLMELPPDLTVFEIGEDYILGRVTDDLGIERVQLWPLDRSDS